MLHYLRTDLFGKLSLRRGQGLVEYALILVLVAVVVIIVVGLLGERVQEVFCDVVLAVNSGGASAVNVCQGPRVTCSGVPTGGPVSGSITFEALVTDPNGDDTISYVDIFIDDVLEAHEGNYHYCLRGPDSGCTGFNTAQLSNGSHTIRAVAHDNDGNTGECTVSFTTSN